MLPALDIKATVKELFLRLSPLFRFIDYGLLDHLISRFGSLEMQKDTKSYLVSAKFKYSCKRQPLVI